MIADRQTHTHTDTLITIVRSCIGSRVIIQIKKLRITFIK